jgi:predicted transcriptional regulator
MPQTKKHYTGVALDQEVVQFLADLSRETQRTRSWLINAIIRDQARRIRLEQESNMTAERQNQPPIIRV